MIGHDGDSGGAEGGTRRAPVGLPSDMPPDRRRAYRAVLIYFLTVTAALMWPVYELASGIEPRILEVPFSLAYLVVLLLGSFVVLLGLYLWEGRRWGHEEPDEGGSAGDQASTAGSEETRRPEGGSRG